uniref:Selectin P n=1 Tax=Sinocyclocheilus rhinocerous TaxID=307959 RepID=A0A673I9Z9_9TELE
MKSLFSSVEGWTYYWTDNETMSWNETRKWCQNHYTDIVMVHNENVTRFLKENVKNKTSPYYWIGMQKINGTWMWVANGQIMKYQNWATNEPNNNKSNENCVELYTSKTNNNGKWNDDNCQLAKYPLCQKAHCPNDTCTDREDCIEQVKTNSSTSYVLRMSQISANFHYWVNYSFEIFLDHAVIFFFSPVVSCDPLSAPLHGRMNCSGLFGNHSFNSNCTFSCAGGYKLNGAAELKCNSSGAWNAPPPSCAGFSEPKNETGQSKHYFNRQTNVNEPKL